MKEVPSDVVELIIAVDLDPTNPSEPINVSSVDASEGKGKGQCQMCAKLFKAIAKMDPEMAAIAEGDLDDDAKVKAIEKLAAAEPAEKQDEADRFDKARESKPKSSQERYGKPELDEEDRPRPKPKREFEDNGEDRDFAPKKKSFDNGGERRGGFKSNSDKAFGRERPEPEDDDEDEDKKEW